MIISPIIFMIFGREFTTIVYLILFVLIPLIGYFSLFIVLIGDSAYNAEDAE